MQSPNQQTNTKPASQKSKSQSAQHSPAAMTEAAMRIPSSAFNQEPKPDNQKTGGWIACTASQSVKAMQSPNQQTNANPHRKNPKPIRATHSTVMTEAATRIPSSAFNRKNRRIGGSEDRRMDSVRSIAIRQGDAIARSTDPRKTSHRQKIQS
tara:strand:- start:205 stop:663 length:459 start_codon:yes stop_codon:yes gene_type:complete